MQNNQLVDGGHQEAETKSVGLVQSVHSRHLHITCNLFSPWFSWHSSLGIKQQSHIIIIIIIIIKLILD